MRSPSPRTGAAEAPASPVPPPPYTPAGWRALDLVARRLMAARLLRSVAQGALVVDFVLYLRALGWSAAAVGLLLGAAGLGGAALMMLGGVLSDRWGRRPFLVAYQVAMTAGSVAVALDPRAWVLVAATVLLGFGRGANGASGPFGPVEQAWLAQRVPAARRPQVFSLNGALGFAGMGLGSLLGSAVPVFGRLWPGLGAYEPLFVVSAVVAAVNWWQVATLPEVAPGTLPRGERARPIPAAPPREQEALLRRRENVALWLLAAVNTVNSLGIGLFSPLLPYWFAVRYGVGAGAIGSVYGLTFLLTAASSLVTGQLAARVGVVRAVVWVRLLGVVLLAAMPLMPTYALAAAVYVVRSVLNRGSAGARQAFGVGLVRDQRRGLASSVNGLSFRLPSAVGPAVGGWMMSVGSLDLPFYVSAGLQFLYVLLFGTLLGRYERPASEEEGLAAGTAG